MTFFLTEGIVLQTNNFQDYDQILTVFAQHEGMIKLIVKGANRPKRRGGSVTSPLTKLEIIYARGKGELLKCRTLSLLNAHLFLRENLSWLEAACEMAQGILLSQFPNQPAPALYALFQAYLEKIPTMSDPQLLTASFYIKLLRHDGLLGITPQTSACSTCGEPLTQHYLSAGECFCRKHAPLNSLAFDQEEISFLILLGYCQTYQQLGDVPLSPEFFQKIKLFFKEQF